LIKIFLNLFTLPLTCSTNKLERLSIVSFSSLAYLMAAPMMKKFFVIFTFDNILLKCSSSLLTHSTNKLERLIPIKPLRQPSLFAGSTCDKQKNWDIVFN
jgi:hypothetical protein